jgi:hypothetical protein
VSIYYICVSNYPYSCGLSFGNWDSDETRQEHDETIYIMLCIFCIDRLHAGLLENEGEWNGMISFRGHGTVPTPYVFGSEKNEERNGFILCSVGGIGSGTEPP